MKDKIKNDIKQKKKSNQKNKNLIWNTNKMTRHISFYFFANQCKSWEIEREKKGEKKKKIKKDCHATLPTTCTAQLDNYWLTASKATKEVVIWPFEQATCSTRTRRLASTRQQSCLTCLPQFTIFVLGSILVP